MVRVGDDGGSGCRASRRSNGSQSRTTIGTSIIAQTLLPFGRVGAMSPSGATPRKGRRTTAELLGGGFVVWAFIWENARQALGDVTNPTFIIPMPRAARLVEAFILVVVLAYVLVAHRNRAFEWAAGATVLLLAVAVAVCSSVIGVLAGYTTASAA